MAFAGMNHLAIFVAAIAGWLVGAVWYTALSEPWLRAGNRTREELQANAKGVRGAAPYAIAFIAELIMAYVLAGAIGHLGPGQVTIGNGIVSAAILWAGFVGTTVLVNNTFGGRKPMLAVIDAGHWLAVLIVMGAVIGAFGV
jgi:hypothetical protein